MNHSSDIADPRHAAGWHRFPAWRVALGLGGAALAGFLLGLLGATLIGCSRQPADPAPQIPAVHVPGARDLGPTLLEDFSSRQVFPLDNWWNLDVTSAPVDSSSAAYINFIGPTRTCHPDFGPPPYGIPYAGVPGTQALEQMTFDYSDESDPGAPGRPPGYPVPLEARTQPNWIEGAVPGGGTDGDRHLLLIDRDHWLLFETWATQWDAGSGQWLAGSGAAWDLSSDARRPDSWTSADAAGLAIFPGLVRYDEASSGAPIRHAFRVTVRATNGDVWPASHVVGHVAGALPLGARLRLKASVDLSGFDPMVQRIFQAMKTYGFIVADQGTDMYITGTMDARWNNDILNPAFRSLTANDFEVLQLGWNPVTSGVGRR
jgi:hypothetical protein